MPGKSGSDTTRMVILAVTAAALAGTVAYFVFKAAATGDEPPIRVKGGSLHLELLRAGGDWDPHNNNTNGTKWEVAGLERGSPEFLIFLAPKDAASCPLPDGNPNNENQFSKKKVRKIDLLYHLESNTDPNKEYWVELHATGNKTKAEVKWHPPSSSSLKLVESNSTLTLWEGNEVAKGFIKAVRLGNVVVCTFADEKGLDSVLITEEP